MNLYKIIEEVRREALKRGTESRMTNKGLRFYEAKASRVLSTKHGEIVISCFTWPHQTLQTRVTVQGFVVAEEDVAALCVSLRNSHEWLVHTDCRSEFCSICHGGLAVCVVCGCAEGELPTDCPGFKLGDRAKLAIFNGTMDYKNSVWHTTPNRANSAWVKLMGSGKS